MLSYILMVLLLLALAFVFKPSNKKGSRIPGPKGMWGSMQAMSTVGNVSFLGFHRLSMKWGSILQLNMGPTKNIIILSEFEDIKAVHSSEHAEYRAPLDIPNLIFMGDFKTRGVLFNSGPAWRELRRFTIKSLKDLGFNKSASEEAVLAESVKLVAEIRRQADCNKGVVDMDLLFNKAVLNVVWKFVSNERYEYNDPRLIKMLRVLDTFMTIGQNVMGKPLGIFSFLRFVPPFRKIFLDCYNGVKELRDFIGESIAEHAKNLDKDDPKDFIDMFLCEVGSTPNLSVPELTICALDLFTAGSETSSKGLGFAIVIMIRYPEVQQRIQDELDQVLQGRTLVTMADKVNLPYTEATVNEVMRFCNVVPVVAPHLATADIPLREYVIRKGSTIITNTYSVHMDPKHWQDPQLFKPERFLSKGVFTQDERNIPFGIGKRKCLGEGLARMENFLFFSNLMLHFRFSAHECPPSLDPVPGFSNGPAPFLASVQQRNI